MGDAVDRLVYLARRVPVVSHPRVTEHGVTRVKAHMRDIGPEPDPWVEDITDARREALKEARRKWQRQAVVGMALGHLSVEEVKEKAAGGYIPGGHREEEIKPLPPVLYHATTALSKVHAEGLKTRGELEGVGLGGGPSDMVSFTDDPEVAERIAEVTLEANDVLNGRFTVEQMIARAKEEGWYLKLESAAGGPKFLRDVRENVERHWSGGIEPRAYMVEKYGEGDWRPVTPLIKGRDGIERTSTWERTGTPEWKREHVFDFWRGPYLSAMENHYGWRDRKHMDPLFFTPNLDYLQHLDRSQIGVVTVHTRPGSMGTHEGGILGEWRTWTGEAVLVLTDADT